MHFVVTSYQNKKYHSQVLNHTEYTPLHCQILFADRVVEELNAVVLHHRLQKEEQKNSPLLIAHFLQAGKNSLTAKAY